MKNCKWHRICFSRVLLSGLLLSAVFVSGAAFAYAAEAGTVSSGAADETGATEEAGAAQAPAAEDSKLCIRGDIIFTPDADAFEVHEDAWLVVVDGVVEGIYGEIPDDISGEECCIVDTGGALIIPGFCDLHVHAPQYPQIGMGMDEELLGWLNNYTFDTESAFADTAYAEGIYRAFVDDLAACGTTRSLIFATIHEESDKVLVDLLAEMGLGAYVGKVNMDSNSSEALTEDTAQSLVDTEDFIQYVLGLNNPLIQPVITPRFVPSCSAELMQGLGELAAKYEVRVQSHLNENTDEIAWVKELFPEYDYYYQVYEAFGLFGQETTAMAHCIHLTDDEVEALAESGVYAVHCPLSNLNLSSGLMRLRRMMNEGVTLALGSDVGGGNTLFMPQVIASAIQVSKMVSMEYPEEEKLSLSEAFWLATKSGGSFFGKVGSFEEGYEADVLVIGTPEYIAEKSVEERLEWFIYDGDKEDIEQVYVAGRLVRDAEEAA